MYEEQMHAYSKHRKNIWKDKKEYTSQMAHQAGDYLQVLLHEATSSISTPPGWDATPSQGCFAVRLPGTYLHCVTATDWTWTTRIRASALTMIEPSLFS